MTATTDKSPHGDDYGPAISQSVAGIFAIFGLSASLGMGWMLARSTAGLPPFQLPGRAATTTGVKAEVQTLKITAADLKRFVTQHFGGQSVYRITYCTEAVARATAARNSPAPVSPWDFPKALAAPISKYHGEDDGPDVHSDAEEAGF